MASNFVLHYGKVTRVERKFAVFRSDSTGKFLTFSNEEDSIGVTNLQRRYGVGQSVVCLNEPKAGKPMRVVCPTVELRDGYGRVEKLDVYYGFARLEEEPDMRLYFSAARLRDYFARDQPLDLRQILKTGERVRFKAMPQQQSFGALKAVQMSLPGRQAVRPTASPCSEARPPSSAGGRGCLISPPLTVNETPSVASADLDSDELAELDLEDELNQLSQRGDGDMLDTVTSPRAIQPPPSPVDVAPCVESLLRVAPTASDRPPVVRPFPMNSQPPPTRAVVSPEHMSVGVEFVDSPPRPAHAHISPTLPPRLLAAAQAKAAALDRRHAEYASHRQQPVRGVQLGGRMNERVQPVVQAQCEGAREEPSVARGLRGREDRSAQTEPLINVLAEAEFLKTAIGQMRELVAAEGLGSAYVNYSYPHLGVLLFPP